MSSAPECPETNAPPATSRGRERFFFGVGLVILPPFWSWWTLRRGFTDRQRTMAFMWSSIYLLVVMATWDLMRERYLAAALNYPLICARLAYALGLWWTVRLLGWWRFTLCCVMGIDIIAIQASLAEPVYDKLFRPHPWTSLLPVFIFAALHLLLEPARRWLWRPDEESCE